MGGFKNFIEKDIQEKLNESSNEELVLLFLNKLIKNNYAKKYEIALH